METEQERIAHSAEKQFDWWKIIGWTFPFVALATIALLHIFNASYLVGSFLILAGIVVVTTMVIWWWWVLFTIKNLAKFLLKSEDKIAEVKDEIEEIKEEIFVDKSKDI